MSWKTEISLKNNSDNDINIKIPKGQIFEHKNVGTGIQNVASAREYRLIIPANSRLKVEIEVYCINRHLSAPSGQFGNLTIFKIANDFTDHNYLWDILSHPKI
jgi:hypothetical protein